MHLRFEVYTEAWLQTSCLPADAQPDSWHLLACLQVADCYDGTIYASAVTAAFDYALRMGAHIVQVGGGSVTSKSALTSSTG
jgi:hypothetical protein